MAKFGKKDLIEPGELHPKNFKARVNMLVDLEVLDEIRKRAAAERLPYQTWINQKLKQILEGKPEVNMADLNKRVIALERLSKSGIKRSRTAS